MENIMTVNVGKIDRIIRMLLGLVLLYLAFLNGLPAFDAVLLKYAAAAVGLVMLIVATTRICPVYTILGFTTCRN